MNALEAKLTACKDCVHHLEQRNSLADAWYNHFCKASARVAFDAIQGAFVDAGHLHCREVNTDGKCPKFSMERFS